MLRHLFRFVAISYNVNSVFLRGKTNAKAILVVIHLENNVWRENISRYNHFNHLDNFPDAKFHDELRHISIWSWFHSEYFANNGLYSSPVANSNILFALDFPFPQCHISTVPHSHLPCFQYRVNFPVTCFRYEFHEMISQYIACASAKNKNRLKWQQNQDESIDFYWLNQNRCPQLKYESIKQCIFGWIERNRNAVAMRELLLLQML